MHSGPWAEQGPGPLKTREPAAPAHFSTTSALQFVDRPTWPPALPRRPGPRERPRRRALSGKGPGKRKEFFYWTDDGQLAALRYDQWKLVFMEQKAHGLRVWQGPLTPLRAPMLFSARSDPFERADHESGGYDRWFIDHLFVMMPAQAFVAQHLATYKEFPPRQKPGSFSLDKVLEQLQEAGSLNR